MFRLGTGGSPHAWEIPNDLLSSHFAWLRWTPNEIDLFTPKAKIISEIRTSRDLDICRAIYERSSRIGDETASLRIEYGIEFMMNSDAKDFPPLDKWESADFRASPLGHWENGAKRALPLYEGRMIGSLDPCQKGWVSGKGRTAVWREVSFDCKRAEPQYLMDEELYLRHPKRIPGPKIALMDVTSATNARTSVSTILDRVGCGHSIGLLTTPSRSLDDTLLMCGVLNSLVFDYTVRQRHSGLHMSWFIIEECPFPRLLSLTSSTKREARVAFNAARLALIQRWFAPLWLKARVLFGELSQRQWKHWWAVSAADRLRLIVEIDALCADLYCLNPDDFDWIVRDDRRDPKGFYRVDRQLPFRERLTGLAAAAFRALKDGKWSAESAASLSNDQFFEILGIPELTNAEAAAAKGLPGPHILKRDGCHVWKPEDFPADDPRYGWTWDHCWQDAVALLGSEDAVSRYVEERHASSTEDAAVAEQAAPFALSAGPPRLRQGKLF